MRVLVAAVVVGGLLIASGAEALPILYTPGSINVTTPVQPGVRWWADSSGLDTSSFTLDDGQSHTFWAFQIGTDPFQSVPSSSVMPVYADFNFIDPLTTVQLTGTASGFWDWNTGYVSWATTYVTLPQVTFRVDLSTANFKLAQQDEVAATVRQIDSRPLRPVPEPGALLSFLMGGALIAGVSRRRAA